MNIINNFFQRAKNPSDTLKPDLQAANAINIEQSQPATIITFDQLQAASEVYKIAGHTIADLVCKGLLYMYNNSHHDDDQREFYYYHLRQHPHYETAVSQYSRWRHNNQKEKRDERRGNA